MNRKTVKNALFICVILILVLVVVYSGLRILESTLFLHTPAEVTSKTITHKGEKYYPRQDITVVMVMGINQTGKVVPTEFNDGGPADMLMLMVFDERTESCSVLSLNRDMMVDMPVLNDTGRAVGVFYGQLGYAHTFGDGMEVSCENVRKTVSNLLKGVTIDYYFSMNMDAISVLNDAVGGVTVNITDDFSAVTDSLPMGRVTLNGDQAVTYVQTRWNVSDHLNINRMERHKEYMRNFVPALQDNLENKPGFVVEAYEKVSDFIVTDCTIQILSRLETDYGDYEVDRFLTLEGENVLGDVYYEFYPDEEKMMDLILELFFDPK